MKKMIELKGIELVVGDYEEPLLFQKMTIALVLDFLHRSFSFFLLLLLLLFFQNFYLIIYQILFIFYQIYPIRDKKNYLKRCLLWSKTKSNPTRVPRIALTLPVDPNDYLHMIFVIYNVSYNLNG